MDEQLKNLLRDLKEELDKFDFQKTRFDDAMKKFDDGMKQDIADGLYKNTPEYRLQQLIEDEKNKIREKYNNQNNELSDENGEKLKESVYKQISSAIKDYHLDMVLEANKANKMLVDIEAERNSKLQEIDQKIEEKEKEKQEKINKIDKKIAQIKAKQVHLMYYNSENQLDAERDMQALAFVQEINELKSQRDSISNEEIDLLKQERNNTEEKYNNQLKEQSDMLQHYSQQKERAAKFLSSIRLSDKSIKDVQNILFGEEEPVQENSEPENPAPGTNPTPGTNPAPETNPTPGTNPVPETNPAPGTNPAPETNPTPGTNPAPGTKPAPETKPAPGTKPTPGTKPAPGTKPTPEKKPAKIANFKIEITKNGSRLVVTRDGEEEPQEGDWHESYDAGEHLENIAFEVENKKLLQRARLVGDKFVINELMLAITSKQITYEEGKSLLNTYLETLSGKEIQDSTFELAYNLRGLSSSELDGDQKEYIEQKAKEAKKLEKTGNINVKPGFFRAIGWKLEKIGTKLFNKNIALPEPGEKQSSEYMDARKQELKERLRKTGKVTENQEIGQGLNAALKQQDEIKQKIDDDGR